MKNVIVYLLIGVFFGCNTVNKPKKPDNLISKDKMVNVMYDVFLINSAKGLEKKTLELNGILPEDFIYKKHSIDSAQFALSNNYYAFDTKVYKSIMDQVKSRISAEQKKYEAINEKEAKEASAKKDSIKKLADTVSRKIIKPKNFKKPVIKD